MKPKKTRCLQSASARRREEPNFGPIDSRATEALRQLRIQGEELALELRVRLRVLGKSLAAACPEQGAPASARTETSVAYQQLRRQLEVFLAAQTARDLSGEHYFPVIRHYLLDALPFELNSCSGTAPCRIELVETAIALLSDSFRESDEITGGRTLSLSV